MAEPTPDVNEEQHGRLGRRAADRASITANERGDGEFCVLGPQQGQAKSFVWALNERIAPKTPKVPSTTVIAVRVADATEKEALLASGSKSIFTEPHYNGFPAVLVRLPTITPDELRELIIDAWRCRAPPSLVADWANRTSATGSGSQDVALRGMPVGRSVGRDPRLDLRVDGGGERGGFAGGQVGEGS